MFSVVIPVYNHSQYLREAVISALRSDLVKEILLCDDGSNDGSADLCAELALECPQRVFDYSDKPSRNLGAHNRLNQLCELSKQPWIRVLNSDDFFLPGSFEAIQLLVSIHRANFISGSMLICDKTSQIKGTKRGVFDPEYPLPTIMEPKSFLNNEEIRGFLLNQNFIATTSNMVFTRNLFDKVGGFSDFRYAHDWDFALRASILGNCLSISIPLLVYRIHGSNTIKEVSPHMDGEITRLFATLLQDFPEMECPVEHQILLDGNRHISPFPSKPFKNLPISDLAKHQTFFLPPQLPRESIPTVLLALGVMDYDFLVVSRSLAHPPAVSSGETIESIVSFGDSVSFANSIIPSNRPLAGRIIRAPSKQQGIPSCPVTDLLPEADVEGSTIFLQSRRAVSSCMRTEVLANLAWRLNEKGECGLPVVFVLPIFLAVGGVERNTIEVIRNLRDRYRFVVVTTEFLSERQGSLHWQLEELEVPVFDLAEIAEQHWHLDLLAILAAVIPPKLVWICNGSPWLVENSKRLRRLFAKVPIIDQEVYDTEVGWIAHYNNKGIQSFDHFIAINKKIRSKFLADMRIPSHRISLIYHALNDSMVSKARLNNFDAVEARRELGIPQEVDKVFIFVGRLTDQKRPLSFLNLVQSAQRTHPSAFFLMVGDGELTHECNEFIRINSLTNLKRIPYHPSPPKLMRLADGMVITSIYEGLPIAMLEALAMGLPVISTDVGDIRVILKEYGAGIVSKSFDAHGNPEIRLELWSEFISNLSEYQAISKSLAEKALNRFKAATVSKEYDELFTKSLKIYSPNLE